MISYTNINGIQYKVAHEDIHRVGDLPEGLRVHISNTIQQGLGNNESADEIMNNIVMQDPDGSYYLITSHDRLLIAIEPDIAENIRSIMTGDNEIM